MTDQLLLPFGPLQNSGLFSSHWLANRLQLEPEWSECREEARRVLDALTKLWKVQRKRVEHYGDEQGLEHALIQPVLEALGWKLKYQTFLQGRKPDYGLFLDDGTLDAGLRAGRNSPEFWNHTSVVADAKAWHILLDRPSMVNNQREYPPQQMEWYLDRSRLDFGILTNGRLWRLIPRERQPHQGRFDTFYEFDLADFLEEWRQRLKPETLLDEFLYFWLFFSPVAFKEIDGRKPLIWRAVEGSSEYRLGIGEDLRDRAFEALRICISGLLDDPQNELNPDEHLELCRNESFILLYRLLFIMYAEDRGLPPYGTNRLYTNNRSLRRHRDEIAAALDRIKERRQEDYSRKDASIWSNLRDLFDLVDRGHARYGVPAYNGGLFDPSEHPFWEEKRVPDWHLARVMDQLGRAVDPTYPDAGLCRIDYRDLAIQHLGSIYEGLLELEPRVAAVDMVVVARRRQGQLEERVTPASGPLPSGFQRTDVTYKEGVVYLADKQGRAAGHRQLLHARSHCQVHR